MASRLWRFLNTDIEDLFSAETVTEGVEAAGKVFELAKVVQEQGSNVEQLAPFVGKISTLLDVLNSPLGEIVAAGLPFVSLGAKLLAFFLEKTKKQPTLEQCVALVSQAAYLESLKEFLKKDSDLLSPIGQTPVSAPVQQQIKQLSELELDEDDARRAVVCFHDCKLAEVFGQVLLARLKDAGLDEEEAEILTARVAWNTYRYLIQAWAESGEAAKHLAPPSFREWQQAQEKYQSVEDYLREHIAQKPEEKVFGEDFTFRDIYVPLKAKPLDGNGNEVSDADAFDLETWAKNVLQDPQKQDLVMFVQGGPGRGKSVFSRMFADWVRKELYPIWIPVLIRLRDIPKLQESFPNTLRDAVSAKFAGDDWLKDRNTKYLFLLDGFDELLMEGRTSGGLEQFLRQVSQFQRDSQQGKDMGHRVLITGRTLALQGIERQMPDNLERVRIEVMDSQLQQQWLDKWERIFDRAKREAFEAFLQDRRCPERVQELAREPLLLYLLAAMHRDGELQVADFEGASSTVAKIKIYEKFLNWVLTKQRPEWLTRQLTEQEIEDLRRILSEAGLCVVQSGGEFASLKAIEFRLKQDEGAKALLEEAQESIGDNPLRNALAAFYIQKGSQEGSVEFAHKSFGEFLCADRLKESILEWTERSPRRKRFNIQEEQLHGEIYDLLGYGALTPEIVEYLMGLLTASEEFRPVELFERLKDFYFRWGDGEFIDAPPENMPQKKMRQLREQGIQLGQRQIDVYAGLNVMILLLELHRYSQERENLKDKVVFYPCGEPNSEGDINDSTLLFPIIGYSSCVGADGFVKTVGQFLSGADLSGAYLRGADLRGADLRGAYLRGADLRGADLSGADLIRADLIRADLIRADLIRADLSGADLIRADLIRADLRGAYLSGADLRGADLRGADLSRADLSGADLSRADLSGAYLSGADLRGADLSRADLSGADLSGADLSRADLSRADLSGADLSNGILGNILWDEATNWENVRGLETAVNLEVALRQQLGL